MPNISFRDKFASLPAGSERENLIYNEAIKLVPPKTVPITISIQNGMKLTYYVMPDFLIIDGIRVPMAGTTAQKIADHFNMKLPTAKMAQQIYNSAKTQITAKPLSGTGTTINNKYYSGKDIVEKGVNRTDFALAYNDIVNKQIQKKDPNDIIDGPYKTILQPINGKLGLYGLYDKNGNPIQGWNGETPHLPNQAESYASALRLIDNKVVITTPDGKSINTTLDQIQNKPTFAKNISHTTGVHKYTNNSSVPSAGPPSGYISAKFPTPEVRNWAESKAKELLTKDFGTTVIEEKAGKKYLFKVEPHSNKPKGVSVYEASGSSPSSTPPVDISYTPAKPEAGRAQILQRITDFINKIDKLI